MRMALFCVFLTAPPVIGGQCLGRDVRPSMAFVPGLLPGLITLLGAYRQQIFLTENLARGLLRLTRIFPTDVVRVMAEYLQVVQVGSIPLPGHTRILHLEQTPSGGMRVGESEICPYGYFLHFYFPSIAPGTIRRIRQLGPSRRTIAQTKIRNPGTFRCRFATAHDSSVVEVNPYSNTIRFLRSGETLKQAAGINFSRIGSVAITASGIVATDYGNNRLIWFDANGAVRTTECLGPSEVVATEEGTVAVLEQIQHRVLFFNEDGTVIGQFQSPNRIHSSSGLAIAPNNRIAVMEYNEGELENRQRRGHHIRFFDRLGHQVGFIGNLFQDRWVDFITVTPSGLIAIQWYTENELVFFNLMAYQIV